jgi:hypothetical protein
VTQDINLCVAKESIAVHGKIRWEVAQLLAAANRTQTDLTAHGSARGRIKSTQPNAHRLERNGGVTLNGPENREGLSHYRELTYMATGALSAKMQWLLAVSWRWGSALSYSGPDMYCPWSIGSGPRRTAKAQQRQARLRIARPDFVIMFDPLQRGVSSVLITSRCFRVKVPFQYPNLKPPQKSNLAPLQQNLIDCNAPRSDEPFAAPARLAPQHFWLHLTTF